MLGYQITVESKGKIAPETIPAGLNGRVAKVAGDHVKEHLFRLDDERANELGGKRSHFYWNAAQSVRHEALVDGAVVTINKLGLRQRWLGGVITAKNVKYLTIPARTESYNVPAPLFPRPLKFVQFKSGAKALVVDDRKETETVDYAGNVKTVRGKRNKRIKTAGLVEYWLVPSVYQKPDETVLPSAGELASVVSAEMERYFA